MTRLLPRLEVARARAAMRLIGAVAAGLGLSFALAPRLGLRALGMESDGRSVVWLARLFACRDIGLGLALVRAAADDHPDPRWLDLVAALQLGDVALSTALLREGVLSRRAYATVVVGAPPTLAACAAGRLALMRA